METVEFRRMNADQMAAVDMADYMALTPEDRDEFATRFDLLLDQMRQDIDDLREDARDMRDSVRDYRDAMKELHDLRAQEALMRQATAQTRFMKVALEQGFSGTAPVKADPFADLPETSRLPWNHPDTVARFLKTKDGARAKLKEDFEFAFRMFEEVVADKALGSIADLDIIEFKNMLAGAPSNFTKRFKTRSAKQAIALNAARKAPFPTMEEHTVNKHLDKVKNFLKWAKSERLIRLDPGEGIRYSSGKPKGHVSEDRDPYTIEHLNKIVRHPVFTGVKRLGYTDRTGRGAVIHEPGPHQLRDHHYFWTPLIALFSGMRLNEIGQLTVGDIVDYNGMPHFDVNDNGGKLVKSTNAKRRIPMHPELIRIGFMDYVAKRKKGRLFPEWQASGGYFSNTFSKFWNDGGRFLDSLGIKTDKLSFHSFRHTFQDAMDRAGWPESLQVKIFGHAENELGKITPEVRRRYRKRWPLEHESQMIEAIHYPGLDLTHLYK